MHFIELNKLLPAESMKDLYLFWLKALTYRKGHRHLENELANYVFLKSNEARAYITFEAVADDITYEFAALESIDKKSHAQKQWALLESHVNKEFLKLTSRES